MSKPKPSMLGTASLSAHKCYQCGKPIRALYMVYDHVWEEAFKTARPRVGQFDGWHLLRGLHVGCLERRLGRRLKASDFYYICKGASPRHKPK